MTQIQLLQSLKLLELECQLFESVVGEVELDQAPQLPELLGKIGQSVVVQRKQFEAFQSAQLGREALETSVAGRKLLQFDEAAQFGRNRFELFVLLAHQRPQIGTARQLFGESSQPVAANLKGLKLLEIANLLRENSQHVVGHS